MTVTLPPWIVPLMVMAAAYFGARALWMRDPGRVVLPFLFLFFGGAVALAFIAGRLSVWP